ncbi:hypothetical protein ACOME3_004885 [Neoechinorhynchus agilis]
MLSADDVSVGRLIIVVLFIGYNFIMVPARGAFADKAFPTFWYLILLDFVADFVYALDSFALSRQVHYDEDGIPVVNKKQIRKMYFSSALFVIDLISLLPTEILYIFPTLRYNPMVRINRLLKAYRISRIGRSLDTISPKSLYWKICSTVTLCLLVIHWNGCLYFSISKYVGFGRDEWVYPNGTEYETFSMRYFYSIYWATMMITNVGDFTGPQNDLEHFIHLVNSIFAFLFFAAIIGTFTNIVGALNYRRSNIQQKCDEVKRYMEFHQVDNRLRKRVIDWLSYVQTNVDVFDELKVPSLLGCELLKELCSELHRDKLSTVPCFQKCDPPFLDEVTTYLKPIMFAPGDYVYRKNDVSHKMFIVAKGALFRPADESAKVLIVSKGEHFGSECLKYDSKSFISNVRMQESMKSAGFSEVYCLSRKDLQVLLEDFSEYKQIFCHEVKSHYEFDPNDKDYDVQLDHLSWNLNSLNENIDAEKQQMLNTVNDLKRKCSRLEQIKSCRGDWF